MLRIRFLRTGKKNRPFFRVVLTPQRTAPKGGRFLEILGYYNPVSHEKKINKERVKYWISRGAKASDSMHNMLVSEGVLEASKISAHKKPRAGKETKEVVEGVPKAEAQAVEEVDRSVAESEEEKGEKPEEEKKSEVGSQDQTLNKE